MYIKTIIIVALAIFSFSGCQTTAEQSSEKLYGNFYIRYLQTEQQFRAEAIFSLGDSLEVTKGILLPVVNLDDSKMESRDIGENGIRYRLEKQNSYTPEHSFHFKDESGNEISQKMHLSPIGRFSFTEPIQLNQGLQLQWEGDALTEGEQLILLFTDAATKTTVVKIDGPMAESEVNLDAGKLKDMAAGNGSVYLVKKKFESISHTAFEATTLFEYYSITKNVTFTE